MREGQWSAIGKIMLYLLLTINAVLSGLALASARRTEIAVVESEVFTLIAAETYIHGWIVDHTTRWGLAGGTITLYYEGRFVRRKTTVAGGEFGIGDTAKTGLYQLDFTGPPGWTVVGIEPFANVTDFEILVGGQSCQFRVSPAGGVAGDFRVYCANLQTPTATWIPTPTYTVTPHAPTPTFTATPAPVTPSPTWTPGPTPTLCWRDPPPELVAMIRAAVDRQSPFGDSELSLTALRLGFGMALTAEEAGEVNGERFTARPYSQISILVRWEDGCYSVVDSGSFMP